MSEKLEDEILKSVKTLDIRTALNALHYASRLVKHRIGVVESSLSDKLWVADVSGEPTKHERALGKEIVQLIEKHTQHTVDHWSETTISQVLDMLGTSAASIMRESWGEIELKQAKDYHDFCAYLPTMTDPLVEFNSILDIESATSAASEVVTYVKTLPPKERLILEMRLFDDRSWEDCAVALGTSVTAARQLWYRTLRKMRNQLVHRE
jgi:DNA-directed RNA polymerase specialized sigma subunit